MNDFEGSAFELESVVLQSYRNGGLLRELDVRVGTRQAVWTSCHAQIHYLKKTNSSIYLSFEN